MKDLQTRIADRIKRKQDAGQNVDGDQFKKRSDATDNASAGVPEREPLTGSGNGGAADAALAGADPLDSMKKADLIAYAQAEGVEVDQAMKVEDYRAALRAKLAEKAGNGGA